MFVEVTALFGDQVYEVAPLAVNKIEFPIQITGKGGVIVTVGFATTVTVEFCVWLLQPKLVPFTL